METKNEVIEEAVETVSVTPEIFDKSKFEKVKAVPKKVGGIIKKHAKGFAVGIASTAALAAAGVVMAVKLRDGAVEMPLDLEEPANDLPPFSDESEGGEA